MAMFLWSHINQIIMKSEISWLILIFGHLFLCILVESTDNLSDDCTVAIISEHLDIVV